MSGVNTLSQGLVGSALTSRAHLTLAMSHSARLLHLHTGPAYLRRQSFICFRFLFLWLGLPAVLSAL